MPKILHEKRAPTLGNSHRMIWITPHGKNLERTSIHIEFKQPMAIDTKVLGRKHEAVKIGKEGDLVKRIEFELEAKPIEFEKPKPGSGDFNQEGADKLHELLGKKTLLYTGAGTSYASGIPTFKEVFRRMSYNHEEGKVDGFVEKAIQSPEELAGIWQGFIRSFKEAEPTEAHHAITELLEKNPGLVLGTENVDALHEKAGSEAYRTIDQRESLEQMKIDEESLGLVKLLDEKYVYDAPKGEDMTGVGFREHAKDKFSEFDYIVTVGLSGDHEKVIQKMRELNPDLKVVSVGHGKPEFIDESKGDMHIVADIQKIFQHLVKK